MNNHQRGVYQPLVDNIPVYDLSDDEVEEEERSRLPLLIVIAFLVLAAFAGVVWLAYNQGVARGRAGAAVVVAAPEGPVRTAPSDAGGTPTPFTGLKVYDQPVPPDEEAQASVLAPAAPEPVVSAPPPAATVASTEAPPIRLSPETRAAAPARQAPPAAPPAPARPAAPPPVAASAPSAPPAATASAVAGGAVLQIGAYESEEIANGAWATFKARYGNVAGTLAQDIQRADLGARGIWYRLRVGPFADRAAAVTACETLKTQGATCFVAAP